MKIATIKNIGIHVQTSFLLILGLMGYFAAQFYENQHPTGLLPLETKILFGACSGLLILVGMILHELAHALVSQKQDLEIINIELGFMGARTKLIGEVQAPGDEFKIVIVGPLTSLVLGGISLLTGLYLSILPDFLQLLFVFTGVVNLSLGIYNLLPVFPQDGGRALRALLWKRSDDFFEATKKACRIGIFIGYGFMLGGIAIFGLLGFNTYGLWIALMGVSLRYGAKNALKQYVLRDRLAQVQIRDIMREIGTPPVAKSLPLDQAIGSVITTNSPKYVYVEDYTQIIGIIITDLVLQTPPNIQETMTIGDLMTALEYIPSINIVQDIREAILLIVQNTNHLPFLLVRSETNRIIGVIDEKDIEKALQKSN
jgi:Zn-dependent protease